MTNEQTSTLVAVTVIRVGPPGRPTPYALAVARTPDGLVLGSVDVADPPAAGDEIRCTRTDDGTPFFAASAAR